MKQANFYSKIVLLLTFIFVGLNAINSQTTVPFQPRYQNTINGELTMIGNNILGHHVTDPYTGTDLNNNINMVYIDTDTDASTFSSSSATLNLPSCSKVVYAGLYWGATAAPTTPAPNEVKFKTPTGSYIDITADTTDPALREELDLIYYHDVTSMININNPNGEYFVANVSATEASGRSAGWTLVIVYEDPAAPRRYISTFDGFSWVNTANNVVDFNYSGFTTPPSGPVEGKIGVAAMEGDLGLFGDHFQLRADSNTTFTNISDPVINPDNFFNSTVTSEGALVNDRNPASTNTLGWDQHLVDLTPLNGGNALIGNGETGLTARVTNDVGGDWIYTFLNTLSINVIEPTLQVLTTVEDINGNSMGNNSSVGLDESVWYVLDFENVGTDNAVNTTISNKLPFNVTLDTSSFAFLDESGNPLPTGSVTPTISTINETVDIGGGNTATVQRTLITFTIDDNLVLRESDPANAKYTIRYMVTTSNNCDDYTDNCINQLVNELTSSYDGQESGQNVNAQPGLNGINGCGIGSEGAMVFGVDTSSCLVGSSETVCNDTTLLSSDSGYNAWRWYNEAGDLVGTDETLTITPQPGQTTYRCEQIKIGCTVRDKIFTVLGLDVEYTPFDSLCKGSDNGGITIKVNESSATYKYQLFGPVTGDTGDVTSDTHTFNNLKPGSYSVRVTKAEGCFDIHTFTIDEPLLLTATNVVTDNIMPCNGNRLEGRIEVTGRDGTPFTGTSDGNSYEYSMDGSAFQTSNVFTTIVEGNHTITVKDANGCTTTTIANVDFDEEIEYSIGNEDVVCLNGSNGRIDIDVTQNNAGNTLTYSIDGTNFQSTPSFTGLTVGDYEVTVRKEKGPNTCETTTTVSLVQLVDLQFEVTGGFSCESSSNTITATVADEYKNQVTYRLNGGSANSTGIFENVPAGNHTVTVTAAITNNGKNYTCSADPIDVTVDPYTPMELTDAVLTSEVNVYELQFTGGEPTFEFAILYMENGQPNDDLFPEDDAYQTENSFRIDRSGAYQIYVKDAKECVRKIFVELKFYDIEIPNFFTPNGDGNNDTWYPRFIEKYPNISVMIFDRYQRLITEIKGNTPDKGWDGSYKAKPLPSGDYWYYIKLNKVGDDREFKGHFSLYR